MSEKAKCSNCNERDVFAKGLCSGCYGRKWREERKAERAAAIAEQFPPKQLTSGVTDGEIEAIEGEIVHETSATPETHLTATSPLEMQAAQTDLRAWLEQRLTILERDIIEANAALNEARRNGWGIGALTSARNRAVDEETFYNKILAAVEAGHTIIPDFAISIFAVRRSKSERSESNTWIGWPGRDTYLNRPLRPDCAPAGAGEYVNPEPEIQEWREGTVKTDNGETIRWRIRRTGRPVGPILFPKTSSRSPIMKATAAAMQDKAFDQVGVCLPVAAKGVTRQVQQNTARAGDPLIIGQVLRKNEGGKQRCVSFIIAWHLNLNEL